MKKLAKVVSLVMIGTMLFSMPVSAETLGAPEAQYMEPGSDVGDMSIMMGAIDEHKLVDEYMGNVVTGIWAMDYVLPIGQGGKVILDGVETNVTFVLQKPELSRVYSAKDLAASMGEDLINVVKIDTHVGFGTANVNFLVPSIQAGEDFHVCQYDETTDSWVELNITEIREDHVCVDMDSVGTFAFIGVYAD